MSDMPVSRSPLTDSFVGRPRCPAPLPAFVPEGGCVPWPPVVPVGVPAGPVFSTVRPIPAMCAWAPVLTSGTETTGVTERLVLARALSSSAGMVAVQVPSGAGVAVTGALVWLPSVAETETSVASGCATPETVSGPPVIVPGAVVIALWAQGAIELQPAIGPRVVLRSPDSTTTLVDVAVPPNKGACDMVT